MDGVDSEDAGGAVFDGDGGGEDVGELEGSEDGAGLVFGEDGLIEGDGVCSSGVGDFDLGGFGAAFVDLPEEADFVGAAFLDAGGEGGGGVTGGVLVGVIDVGLEVIGAGPFSGELGLAVVDDDAGHVTGPFLIRVDAESFFRDGRDGEFGVD